MKTFYFLAALLVMIVSGSPGALANKGVFDFVDPCIAEHDRFNDARDETWRDVHVKLADLDHAKASAEYRKQWMDKKRAALRKYFDEAIKPAVEAAGGKDMDAAYARFFDKVMESITPEKVAELQDANFRLEARRYLEHSASSQVDEGEKKLSESCKMDVGNQVLRVAVIAALKPFTFVAGNWTAAEKDGFVAQLIAAPTGINIVDAVKCPIRGCSSESVVNRVLSGRFW